MAQFHPREFVGHHRKQRQPADLNGSVVHKMHRQLDPLRKGRGPPLSAIPVGDRGEFGGGGSRRRRVAFARGGDGGGGLLGGRSRGAGRWGEDGQARRRGGTRQKIHIQLPDGHPPDLLGALAHEAPHVERGRDGFEPLGDPLDAAVAEPRVVPRRELLQVGEAVEDARGQHAQLVVGDVQALQLAEAGEGGQRDVVDLVVLQVQPEQVRPWEIGRGAGERVPHHGELLELGEVAEGALGDALVGQQVPVHNEALQAREVLEGHVRNDSDPVFIHPQLLQVHGEPHGDAAQVVLGEKQQLEADGLPEGPVLHPHRGDGVVIQVQLLQLQELGKSHPRDGLDVVFLQVEDADVLGKVHGELIQLVAVQVDRVHRLDVVQFCREPRVIDLVVVEVEYGYALRDPKRH